MATSSINSSNTQSAMGAMSEPQEHKKSLGQSDFLRLMVAQVKNQDPMQPQANGEFMSQLAQFSTNDGVTEMQKSLQQMNYSMQSNQALQASTLVGKKVIVNSDLMRLGDEGDVKLDVKMVEGVKEPTASVFGKNGEFIKKIPLGQPAPGNFIFSWDGTGANNQRLPPGDYKVQVHGQFEGKDVTLYTMTSANVDSVSFGINGSGLSLNLQGVGTVPFDRVRQVTT